MCIISVSGIYIYTFIHKYIYTYVHIYIYTGLAGLEMRRINIKYAMLLPLWDEKEGQDDEKRVRGVEWCKERLEELFEVIAKAGREGVYCWLLRSLSVSLATNTHTHTKYTCIHIYTYTYTCIYMHIYIGDCAGWSGGC